MTLFCISAALVLIAAAGIVDAAMPDDAYWLASPSDREAVATTKRYCQCKSLTNPCIVCGLPKFIDPEWLKRKIAEGGDEGEIGAGFEMFPFPADKEATAKWSPEEVRRVARRAVDLWRDGSGIELIESPDVLVGNIEAALTAALALSAQGMVQENRS